MNGSDARGGSADGATVETTDSGSELADPVIRPAVEEALATTATAAHARIEGIDRLSRGDRLASILVAVGPGPHSGATVDLARTVAEATDAWLDLFHVVPGDDADGVKAAADTTTGDALLSAAHERIADFERADQWLVEAQTAASAIAAQSPYYDLVVVGESTTGTVGRFVFGSTTESVVDEAAVPVVVVEGDGPTPILED